MNLLHLQATIQFAHTCKVANLVHVFNIPVKCFLLSRQFLLFGSFQSLQFMLKIQLNRSLPWSDHQWKVNNKQAHVLYLKKSSRFLKWVRSGFGFKQLDLVPGNSMLGKAKRLQQQHTYIEEGRNEHIQESRGGGGRGVK